MRRLKLLVPVVALMLIAAACAGDDDGDGGGGGDGETAATEPNTGTVNVLNAMEPNEGEAVQAAVDENLENADYAVEIEASADFEEQFAIRSEGGTLDIALVPQPGTVIQQAQAGTILSLEDMGIDVAALEESYGDYLFSLVELDGEHYGIPTNVNLKSMVWYPKDDFDAAGYTEPTTWDEMLALSDQIVADGGTPWCVGFESGGATGWPATDWMEDIMLRTAGVETYDQWVAHEIPFNDPAVAAAAEEFGNIMFTEGYVLGGAADTPSISFGSAPLPMFEDPPGCWLHRQATFIIGAAPFPEDAVAGEDYDWFPLPPIDQEGTLYAGEFAVVGTAGNREEVIDFVQQFAGEAIQCAQGQDPASSRISANINVGPDCYANQILADSAVILTDAIANDTGRFDASDLMPGEVGAGSFWTGMVQYMQDGPESLSTVLDEIESSWPAE
ncbi:MAG TPA: ABC transporter substrate-binding protein [Actinomycetota bacterium]|jgi:alpha-glucoside transport system substrate-binding protein|nr:ABC transporter substrate-binding protein [Actinomycetota bacterium]